MFTSSSSPVCILLFGAVFLLLPAGSKEFGMVPVSMVVLLVVLSLGEECANQADSFDGFCFHYPWQKIPLTFLCVLSKPVPCISCAFINAAVWTVTEFSF